MIRILELFSGTHSVGKVCKKKGWYIVSLDRDLDDPNNISDLHIKEDIMTWDYKKYPKDSFDVIWASPVCLWWSNLRNSSIGRTLKGMDRPFTREDLDNDIDKYGVPMVDKVREIIDYFYPKYYFIENPKTGRMKDYIVDLPFYDVDYCKYSDWGYKKATRFWTNVEGFIPKICRRDCENIITIKTKVGDLHPGYKTQIKGATRTLHKKNIGVIKVDPDHKIIKSVKHKGDVSTNEFGGVTTILERYRIPEKLIEDLLENIIIN